MTSVALLQRATATVRAAAGLPFEWFAAYQPPELIAEARDRRVRSMVRYAASTVAWYRNTFEELGIDPREVRTAADLEWLPIIDRSTVQRQPEAFRSQSRRARGAVRFMTSGSTGEPVTVWHDRGSIAANMRHSARERRVVMGSCGKAYDYRELSVRRQNNTLQHIGSVARQGAFVPVVGARRLCTPSTSVDEIVAAINEFCPDVIRGYGSFLDSFFRTVVARDLPIRRPKLVVFGGDGLSREGRERIQNGLDIPVRGIYGTVEIFKIAFECGAGPYYHLHEDLAHVRIVDDHGRTVPRGECGHVVVSDLVNRGTVLLNYRLGDLSTRLDGRCPCGRTLELLSEVEGRAEDILTLPDGSVLHPRDLWGVIGETPGLVRYQLVDRREGDFELRLVMADEDAWTLAAPALRQAMTTLLKGAQVEVRRFRQLTPGGSGKLRLVVRHDSRRTQMSER